MAPSPSSTTTLGYFPLLLPTPKRNIALACLTSKNKHSRTGSNPTHHHPLPTTLCNALDGFIDAFALTTTPPTSLDPVRILYGNFAPVDELPPTHCTLIRGSIPECLAGGAYLRNGPNPQHFPVGGYHPFDGDGMLHSLLLPRDGRPIFCSRYVRTNKYRAESTADRPILPNFVSGFHGPLALARGAVYAARVLTGQFSPSGGLGTANTSVAYFADQIHALGESDLPYAVHLNNDGDITTTGRHEFGSPGAMTAHPKKDPVTGEVFGFRYHLFRRPYLTYFWFDQDGKKQPDVPVHSVEAPALLHDFAVTERHVVFATNHITMTPAKVVLRGGMGLKWDPQEMPRIAVMPKHAASESEMRWYNAPGFSPTHVLNAWDEGEDAIVVVAVNAVAMENLFEKVETRLERVRVDLMDGRVTRERLSECHMEFPTINPRWVGRRNRYGYVGIGEEPVRGEGVVKMDLEGKGRVVGRRLHGEGCFGGEVVFVGGKEEGEEDEGYLATYVYDERRRESRFVVMDAMTSELEVVAEVLLPRRVPYGFHGLFVAEEQLQKQRTRSNLH